MVSLKKYFVLLGLGILFVGAIVLFLSPKQNVSPASTQKIKIVTSFYPLAEFAERIGGDHVVVTNLTPPGAEPHDFEPTAKEIAQIYNADLFLYNGGGVDAWATKIAPEVEKQNVSVLTVVTAVDLLPLLQDPSSSKTQPFDEHFWLDPTLMIKEVTAIRDLLIERDPTHQDIYKTSTEALIADLKNLDTQYRIALTSCDLRSIVTSHAAFGYLAREYNFTQIPITGLSPDSEPSAGDLARITQQAKAAGVKYIFFESLVSPKLAQTLASEIDAQTLVLNPIEGLTQEEKERRENYFTLMRQNLENLKTAMGCR